MNPNHRRIDFRNQTWTRRDTLVLTLAFGATLLFYVALAVAVALAVIGIDLTWGALT